jgi:hypothetical protein
VIESAIALSRHSRKPSQRRDISAFRLINGRNIRSKTEFSANDCRYLTAIDASPA